MVIGKALFALLCLGLAVLGILETVASVIVLIDSSGAFIGAIYLGVGAIVTASFGLSTLWKGQHQHACFALFVFSNAVCFIAAIIGTALTSQTLITLDSLSSCAYYVEGATSCDPDVVNAACVGDIHVSEFAATCATQAQHLQPSDTAVYTLEPDARTCWCAGDDTQHDCSTLRGFSDCEQLLDLFPEQIRQCFVYAFPSILTTAILFCFRESSLVIPPQAAEREEAVFALSQGAGNSSGVWLVSANSTLARGLVQTVATYNNREDDLTAEDLNVDDSCCHIETVELHLFNGETLVEEPVEGIFDSSQQQQRVRLRSTSSDAQYELLIASAVPVQTSSRSQTTSSSSSSVSGRIGESA